MYIVKTREAHMYVSSACEGSVWRGCYPRWHGLGRRCPPPPAPHPSPPHPSPARPGPARREKGPCSPGLTHTHDRQNQASNPLSHTGPCTPLYQPIPILHHSPTPPYTHIYHTYITGKHKRLTHLCPVLEAGGRLSDRLHLVLLS